MKLDCLLLLLPILLLSLAGKCLGTQPTFAERINNVSVPVGRDATFTCIVTHLGGFRVGWMKVDTKAIQAIHNQVITTNNHRVRVTQSNNREWRLHIRNVQEEDSGPYMCQINTDPMLYQIGYLEVTVPPRINDSLSTNIVMVPEGSSAELVCRPEGHPKPVVTWRRVDNRPIIVRTNDSHKPKTRQMEFRGEALNLNKITRSDMGSYMCIASNNVPPMVSKIIEVKVHFPPVIHVPNQLIGYPVGAGAILECNVEASPKSIQYWTRNTTSMLINSKEYEIKENFSNYYVTRMTLKIRDFFPKHAGTYFCNAKNSLGEVQGKIEVYEIRPSTEAPNELFYEDRDLNLAEVDAAAEHENYPVKYEGNEYHQYHHKTNHKTPNFLNPSQGDYRKKYKSYPTVTTQTDKSHHGGGQHLVNSPSVTRIPFTYWDALPSACYYTVGNGLLVLLTLLVAWGT